MAGLLFYIQFIGSSSRKELPICCPSCCLWAEQATSRQLKVFLYNRQSRQLQLNLCFTIGREGNSNLFNFLQKAE